MAGEDFQLLLLIPTEWVLNSHLEQPQMLQINKTFLEGRGFLGDCYADKDYRSKTKDVEAFQYEGHDLRGHCCNADYNPLFKVLPFIRCLQYPRGAEEKGALYSFDLVGLATLRFSRWNSQLIHVCERQGDTRERRGGHSRFVGSFNNEGTYNMRLVLGGRKRSKSHQVPNRILRVYMEALRVLSPLWTEGLSKQYSLKAASLK